MRPLPYVIAATALRRERIPPYNQATDCASFAIRPTSDSHTDARLGMARSLFRFASVPSKPRFSHDPVNLAPDCDG
ncbi:hypothetical protein LMTR13_01145 [Bradyrhizobium icense]|uniref:Uncharacterized protein n=1 Tax=Bradyrhizobium icense TaxID=1274631 RepID=A0A1B1U8E4_9BRAD|nr:hypothetical protein LMTR13_01145 [Bradyrhizobium icense]